MLFPLRPYQDITEVIRLGVADLETIEEDARVMFSHLRAAQTSGFPVVLRFIDGIEISCWILAVDVERDPRIRATQISLRIIRTDRAERTFDGSKTRIAWIPDSPVWTARPTSSLPESSGIRSSILCDAYEKYHIVLKDPYFTEEDYDRVKYGPSDGMLERLEEARAYRIRHENAWSSFRIHKRTTARGDPQPGWWERLRSGRLDGGREKPPTTQFRPQPENPEADDDPGDIAPTVGRRGRRRK